MLKKHNVVIASKLPGAKLWENLIAKPVLNAYGVKLRELVIKLTNTDNQFDAQVSRDLWSFVKDVKSLPLDQSSFDSYVRDALDIESELGLLVSANRFVFTERVSASKLIDRSSGKLLRLFRAIRKASGRLQLKPMKPTLIRTQSPQKGGQQVASLRKTKPSVGANR
jgi:hypothetical protein